ncbi:conserved hypothetical protein [Ricinus communis]|uniref:Uncharacterized protein n=1 Tax=Ricinus communis TaxID=3988 RepID=B9RXT3_RICCO|nr:conserved hypothetical protein [Ricinus communis]
MSSEYAMHGQFSKKSDVYSFGVLVLEIITGKKSSSFYQTDGAGDLLSYVWKHWRDGMPLEVTDTSLKNSYSVNEQYKGTKELESDQSTTKSIHFSVDEASITEVYPSPLEYIHQPVQEILNLLSKNCEDAQMTGTWASKHLPNMLLSRQQKKSHSLSTEKKASYCRSRHSHYSQSRKYLSSGYHWNSPGCEARALISTISIPSSLLSFKSTRPNGFYNLTVDQGTPDIVYGLFLCRGDDTQDICKECVSTAGKQIVQRCPREKIALITYDECMYTQDLSVASCNNCLQTAVGYLSSCCNGAQGGRVILPSCKVRYELYPFYGIVAPSPSSPSVVPAPSLTPKGKSLQFDLATIQAAAKSFSADNKLGEGGYGEVYKGTLQNGPVVAVKRLLTSCSGQGLEEFKDEVILLAKLQHRYLVRLLGFCSEGEEKILIFEFVSNKSLDYFLFDFGLARIISVDQSQGNTDRVVGTLDIKSDVYSFGVFLLEIISGKKTNMLLESDNTEDLLNYAWNLWRDNSPLEMLDPTLRDEYSSNEEAPANRPTMATVMLMLNSVSGTIPLLQRPAFYLQTNTETNMAVVSESDQSTSKTGPGSVNAVSITQLDPR